MLEQGPDFWCWFDTTQFSYHCVHPIHAKMFSIQMSISQIVPRVFCTLVLFNDVVLMASFLYMHNNNNYQCKICWDKALTFGVGSIQLSFRTIVFTQYMQRCFQSKCYYIPVKLCRGFALLVLFSFMYRFPMEWMNRKL